MNDLEKLLASLREIDQKLDALLAGDELTAEQQAEHDKLVAARAATLTKIKSAEASVARAEESAAAARSAADAQARRTALEEVARRTSHTPGAGRLLTPDAPTARQPAGTRLDEHGRPTAYFEETDERIDLRFGQTPDAVRRQSYLQVKRQNNRLLKSAGYTPWGEFKSLPEFVRSGLANAGKQSFEDRVNKHFAAVQGMSEGVGGDGGYTVMPEFSTNILDRVYANDLFSRTDNYPVTGNNMTFLANAETSRATGSRAGGLQGQWLGEGATINASKPTLREVSYRLQKLAVIVYLTQELIDDNGVALQEYITRKVSEEFNFMIGDALINGSGVGQPLGILNSLPLIAVSKETGQGAATLQTENITKMYARFYAANRQDMTWLHNQDIEPQLFTMTLGIGAAGVTTYMPPGGLSGSPYATLMGRPMLPIEFAATLGTQGDLIAADLGQVISITKGGVAQAVSMHVQFLTDQVALRFTMRLNAGPWENAPITPYKGTNTQSNFVVLGTRS